MINVEHEDTGHEEFVRVTVDGTQVLVRECKNSGDIIIDTFVNELPVVTIFKATHQTFLRVFKQAVSACNILMETK
jgi:hypothetical protein